MGELLAEHIVQRISSHILVEIQIRIDDFRQSPRGHASWYVTNKSRRELPHISTPDQMLQQASVLHFCWCFCGLWPRISQAAPCIYMLFLLFLPEDNTSTAKLVDYLFMHVSLTPGETSDGTGSSCPWCPCGPVVPDRAGVWSSTLSGVRTPSLSLPSTVGWHSWSAAAVPVPCNAVHPSQMTCPGRSRAEQEESVWDGSDWAVAVLTLTRDVCQLLSFCWTVHWSHWQIQTISHWACSHRRHIRLS